MSKKEIYLIGELEKEIQNYLFEHIETIEYVHQRKFEEKDLIDYLFKKTKEHLEQFKLDFAEIEVNQHVLTQILIFLEKTQPIAQHTNPAEPVVEKYEAEEKSEKLSFKGKILNYIKQNKRLTIISSILIIIVIGFISSLATNPQNAHYNDYSSTSTTENNIHNQYINNTENTENHEAENSSEEETIKNEDAETKEKEDIQKAPDHEKGENQEPVDTVPNETKEPNVEDEKSNEETQKEEEQDDSSFIDKIGDFFTKDEDVNEQPKEEETLPTIKNEETTENATDIKPIEKEEPTTDNPSFIDNIKDIFTKDEETSSDKTEQDTAPIPAPEEKPAEDVVENNPTGEESSDGLLKSILNFFLAIFEFIWSLIKSIFSFIFGEN